MKKKILLIVLCLVAALMVFAACDGEPKVYSVTFELDGGVVEGRDLSAGLEVEEDSVLQLENYAQTGALTSAGCMRSTTVRPAGAARSNASTSCGSCENTTRSCGKSCWSWIAVRWRSSAPARWDSSSRTGA